MSMAVALSVITKVWVNIPSQSARVSVKYKWVSPSIQHCICKLCKQVLGLCHGSQGFQLFSFRMFSANVCILFIFTARCYASAVLAMGLCPPVCPCPSVTSRSSTKTAKHRITQTTPHDTPKTLVFWCQRCARNSTGVTSYEGAECRWGGSKSMTFDK